MNALADVRVRTRKAPTQRQSTALLLRALRERHKGGKWLVLEELRWGTGFGPAEERRIDLLAIDISPKTGNYAIAYEIKASRQDFRNDVLDHAKQRSALLYSNEFFYVAPEGVIPHEEVPPWAGLIEIRIPIAEGAHYWVKPTVFAPRRDKHPASWPLFVSAIRQIKKQHRAEGRFI